MLSEEKIKELADINWEQKGYNPWGILDFARAIEATVLEEQAKAEPVAWAAMLGGHAHIEWGSKRTDDVLHNTPLYLHPSPFALKDSLIEQAFQLVYEAYSRPADTFNDHADWAIWQHGKVIKAFGLLQRVTGRASWAEDNCPAPAPEGMVLVPREPTEAMLDAAAQVSLMTVGWVTLKYQAMIAAAEKDTGR